jgi:hypothetical protein
MDDVMVDADGEAQMTRINHNGPPSVGSSAIGWLSDPTQVAERQRSSSDAGSNGRSVLFLK